MTVFEFQARRIERIAQALAHFVATTAEERLDWKPTCDGAAETRSVLEQVSECILVNRAVAALLRTGERITPSWNEEPPLTFADRADACARIEESARELAGAVRDLPEDALTRTFRHWRGESPGEVVLEWPYRNMAYHAGQINLIQMLAGDAEFHVPPNWR